MAVATGPYTVEELEQARPEAALEDLSDTAARCSPRSARGDPHDADHHQRHPDLLRRAHPLGSTARARMIVTTG